MTLPSQDAAADRPSTGPDTAPAPDASEALGTDADAVGNARMIDVRRAAVFEQADSLIAGATWRDPAQVATWAAELPAGQAVVVYCVFGHEVSRTAATRLREAGVDARFLRGGIDGWQAAGRPLDARSREGRRP